MSDTRLRLIAAIGLVVGALLGMAGTFAPSASLRGLAWGVDRIALIVAIALLTVHHLRRGNDALAAGYLVFLVGEGLILSGAAMDLVASAPSFAAGIGLWATSLALVSAASTMPAVVRGVGFVGSLLFAVVAVTDVLGASVDAVVRTVAILRLPILGDNTVWLGMGPLPTCRS